MAMGKKTETEITVIPISQERAEFRIIGHSPIILYRMSMKAAQELLMPARQKNKAEKQQSLKHNPYEEFANSPYTNKPGAPSLLCIKSTAFKGAIRSTALDMPGASKAQIGRLLYVEGEYVNIFGTPKLLMSVTRQANVGRTPDIRTRCILPEWACRVIVTFTRPQLNFDNVARLVAGAGLMQGVGDWRPEKGNGNYGQFRMVGADEEDDFTRIMKSGFAVQQKAMDAAEPYDQETEDLLAWFSSEVVRRDVKGLKAVRSA